MVVDVGRKWEEVGGEREKGGVKRKGQNAPDSVEYRTARGASRCRTNCRAAHKRQTRSTSCANRRHPHQESSRIWRGRGREQRSQKSTKSILTARCLPYTGREGGGLRVKRTLRPRPGTRPPYARARCGPAAHSRPGGPRARGAPSMS